MPGWITDAPARGAIVPQDLVQQFTTSIESVSKLYTPTFTAGQTSVARGDPVVLDPPVRGTRWVIGNGCCVEATGHRSDELPVNGQFVGTERFAIDFLKLDAQGRTFEGDISKLSNWDIYGQKLYAVADGVVVDSRNDLPDGTPPKFSPTTSFDELDGNHIILDIGDGRFALYAHAIPGA